FVIIGRCQESDLALDDSHVSFRHLYLQLVGGRWQFVNLSGVAGSPGENERGTSGWFDAGDELTAGPYAFEHVAAECEAPTTTSLSTRVQVESAAELPVFDLTLVNGQTGRRDRRIQ